MQIRVRALESVLIEGGYVDPAALDALIETYETKSGRTTARAWSRGHGPTRRTGSGSRRRHRARSPSSATPAARASTWSRVENTPRDAQHGRLHALLVLPVAGARAAAGLVQVRALSLAGGVRPARRARGLRRRPSRPRRRRVLGLDRGGPLPGRPDAPGRHRGLERGAARGTGHARLDDRHRAACCERRARHGRRARLRPRRAGARRAVVPRRVGAAGVRADAGDGRDGRVEHRHVAASRARTGRRPTTCRSPTTSCGWPGWSGCWPSAACWSGARAARVLAAERGAAVLARGGPVERARAAAGAVRGRRSRCARATCTRAATPGCPVTRAGARA